jgi:recombination protein RecA
VALSAIASAQKAGGIAAFIDAEHALDPDYAKKLGVDTDALLVSQPDTGEQALEIADMLVRSSAIDVVVIDSVAALVPRAEIEGEMGDSHVGLQARLMSQAMRKLAGALNQTKTTAIFINQLREKVGVMFGCMSYTTRVTLADGTQEKIGKIVNQRLDVEVLSYDPEQDRVVPRRIVNWFNNGRSERFLQFTVARSGGNGRAQFAATENHLVRTAGGWRPAGELIAGDRVLTAETRRLSAQQLQLILGSLMGDGCLSPNTRGRSGTRFRMGHGAKQAAYLDWKAEMLGNIPCSRSTNAKGAVFADVHPLPELAELHEAVYFGDGKKHLSWEYLKALTPLALAVWYMDDGCFTLRSKGVQERTKGGTGRIEICVEAMSPGSRQRLVDYLRDSRGLDVTLTERGARRQSFLRFSTASSEKFQRLVAPYIHPSMEYKLLPRFRDRFAVQPEFTEPEAGLTPARILDIHVKPPTRSMNRFDIEVEGSHSYFVDGVMVHNSPETTSGGRALKFYACPAGYTADRDPQGRRRSGRQPHPDQGRQEQVRRAFPHCGIRYPFRNRDQPGRRPDRPRGRAGDRAQVRRLVYLRGRPAGTGQGERPHLPARQPRPGQRDREEDQGEARRGPAPGCGPSCRWRPGEGREPERGPRCGAGRATGQRPGQRSRRPPPRWCRVTGRRTRRARRAARRGPSGRAGQQRQALVMAA